MVIMLCFCSCFVITHEILFLIVVVGAPVVAVTAKPTQNLQVGSDLQAVLMDNFLLGEADELIITTGIDEVS